MVQSGKFLESDFTFFGSDGIKSTGTGISGFDSKTNRFTTVWYDSRQTTMSIRQSGGTFDGKTSFYGTHRSLPITLGARQSHARILKKMAAFLSIDIF